MDIIKCTMRQLVTLMDSAEIAGWGSLPISPLRLASQQKNPQLLPDDIVMILAVEHNDLAGYLGALPDNISLGDSIIHIAWASCIWTGEVHRGKGLAKTLTSALNAAWGGNLLLTEFTPAAKSIYDKLGLFSNLCSKDGFRYFYRSFFHEIALNRFSSSRLVLSGMGVFDRVLNGLIDIKNRLPIFRASKNVYLPLNMELGSIAKILRPRSAFVGKEEKFSWIFLNPWLSNDKQFDCGRYYFSTWINCFETRAIQFIDNNSAVLASLVYSRVNSDGKILSFIIEPVPEINYCRLKKSIEYFFIKEKLRAVLSYDQKYNELMQQKGSYFFYKKPRKRAYLVSKPLHDLLSDKNIVPGELDGDIAFT
jgi:hypothetical protein